MQAIDCNSVYKNLRLHANDDKQPLFNHCKTNKNLLLSNNLNKKSTAIEGTQELVGIENSTLKNTVDVLKGMIEREGKTYLTIEWMRISSCPIDEKSLNRACNLMYSHFNPEEPIIHITITKQGIVEVSDADKLRLEGKKALNRAGVKCGFIFGMDIGLEGSVHFHALVQGYLKSYKHVLNRTGWGYHRFEEDRRDYLEDFIPTVKYCLEKPKPNKKAYLRI